MNETALRYFRVESKELVAELEAGLLAYEKTPEVLPDLFRLAHTLKGSARVVRREAIADLAHAMEDVLAYHREAGSRLAQQEVMELLGIVDAVRAELASNSAGQVTAQGSSAAKELDFETVRVSLSDMDGLAGGLQDAAALATALRAEVTAFAELRRNLGSDEAAERIAEQERRFTTFADALELGLGRLGQQANVLRLLDASMAFPELERAAHDAAVLTGKQVSFTTRGGDLKLDGHVLSPLRGALLHLVRNAVAHGIEAPEVRQARGKAAPGHVEVVVERRGQRIAFVVTDDGGGIELEAVRRAARERGLLDEGAEGFDLIFRPGVSTAESVSDLAGRGVGLDAVRAVVRRLKGTVEVRSNTGAGTTFELVVPVSLSSLRALVVRIGERRLLVPLDTVTATVALSPSNCAARGDSRVLIHDGSALALHDLQNWLEPNAEPREPRLALVLRTSRGQVALSATALVGTRDITIRSLPAAAGPSELVLGTAFDSNGDPELVLDAEGLGLTARGVERVEAAGRAKRRRILVVDDSLTTRMLEQSILEGAGYEVDLASTGKEGLEKAMQSEYGLIVTDVEMPGMDGYEFTAETRRRPELRAVPVIMVSSLASEESRRRGAEAGISSYIVKGEFDQNDFLGIVREYIR